MSKHRAARRPSGSSVAMVAAAALMIAMVGGFLVLWPSGASPTAASETIRASRTQPQPKLYPRGLERLVVYGHSMPAGGGASDVSRAYPVLAAEETGLELDNRSEGGTSAVMAADSMESYPSAGPEDAVVIHTGMNDIFRRGDNAVVAGREGIERLLSGTSQAGRRVLVLECRPMSWLDTPPHRDLQTAYDAWNAMLRDEADVWPNVDLLDTCAEWDPSTFTDPPKYHPNDAGHALIAGAIAEVLARS